MLGHTSMPVIVASLTESTPHHFLYLDHMCPYRNLSRVIFDHCSVHVLLHCASGEPQSPEWLWPSYHLPLYHNCLLTCFHPRLAWDVLKVPRILFEPLASRIVLTTIICGRFIVSQENKKKINLIERLSLHHWREWPFLGLVSKQHHS